MRFVTIPGIDGSGGDHWQSIWEAEWGPRASRIEPASWVAPELDDWCDAIDVAVRRVAPQAVVLVAHSLGCLAAAQWIHRSPLPVRGVFLVAPPDRTGATFPAAAAPTFTVAPERPLAVPGLIVSSDDDPYCTERAGRRLARAWALPRITAGSIGHINSRSGLGRWDRGHTLLTGFVASLAE